MTPLSKELNHLYEDAVWVVIDPWVTTSERDNYVAQQIFQYIKYHQIKKVFVLNDESTNNKTNPLFLEFKQFNHATDLLCEFHDTETDIVFVGFHNGECVESKGTRWFANNKEKNVYIKMDLVSTLPIGEVYDFFSAFSKYPKGVQLI